MVKINNIYEYGTGIRSEEGGDRHYLSPSGNKVPSVTTILSKSKDMRHLLEWRKRIGDAAADTIMRESSNLGTMMHTHLEKHVRGEDRPGGTNIGRIMAKKMADVIIENALCHVDEVWGIEVPLLYDNLWAGTSDLVGVWKGKPAIMDFKTTIKPKTLDRVDDYFLQLVAYLMAHNLTHNTDIKTGVIFMCSRDMEYQQFVIDESMIDSYKLKWSLRVEKYYDEHVFSR